MLGLLSVYIWSKLSAFYALSPHDWLGVTLRLAGAMLVGTAIGLEREAQNKAAGLRTHILVSLGAAIFTLIPILLGETERSADALPRVIQGIATGIGFVGAGEILQDSRPQNREWRIVGLTSAAAIWVSAALGVAAACGLWSISLIGVILSLLVLRLVKKLENYI